MITRLPKIIVKLISILTIISMVNCDLAFAYPQIRSINSRTIVPELFFSKERSIDSYDEAAAAWLALCIRRFLRDHSLAAAEDVVIKIRDLFREHFNEEMNSAEKRLQLPIRSEEKQVFLRLGDYYVRFFDPKFKNLPLPDGVRVIRDSEELNEYLSFQVLRPLTFEEREAARIEGWDRLQRKYPFSHADEGVQPETEMITGSIQSMPAFSGNLPVDVLELGSGDSHDAAFVKEAIPNAEIFTLDATQSVPGGVTGAKHTRAMMESLPYADGSFDAAYSVHAWGYVDRKRAGEELFRVLRPGGRAFIITMHPDSEWLRQTQAYSLLLKYIKLARNSLMGLEYSEDMLAGFIARYGETLESEMAPIRAYQETKKMLQGDETVTFRDIEDEIEELEELAALDYDRNNLFKDASEVKRYAHDLGFEDVQVRLVSDGSLVSWAITMDKPRKTGDGSRPGDMQVNGEDIPDREKKKVKAWERIFQITPLVHEGKSPGYRFLLQYLSGKIREFKGFSPDRELNVAELGCGNSAAARNLKENFPDLRISTLDPSDMVPAGAGEDITHYRGWIEDMLSVDEIYFEDMDIPLNEPFDIKYNGGVYEGVHLVEGGISGVNIANGQIIYVRTSPDGKMRNAQFFNGKIRLIKSRRAEFEDGQFDIVYSNYAWGYTDLERSGRELNRILRDGGRAVLLTMYPGSGWLREMDIIRELSNYLADLKDMKLRAQRDGRRADIPVKRISRRILDHYETLSYLTAKDLTREDAAFLRAFRGALYKPNRVTVDEIGRCIDELEGILELDYDRGKLFHNEQEIYDYAERHGFKVVQLDKLNPVFHKTRNRFIRFLTNLKHRAIPDERGTRAWGIVLEKKTSLGFSPQPEGIELKAITRPDMPMLKPRRREFRVKIAPWDPAFHNFNKNIKKYAENIKTWLGRFLGGWASQLMESVFWSPDVWWEEQGVPNTAMFMLQGDFRTEYPGRQNDYRTAFFMYRAVGRDEAAKDGVSRLGLAMARIDSDGNIIKNTLKRFPLPVMDIRPGEFDEAGCEDPRAAVIDGKVVISYTAVQRSSIGAAVSDIVSKYRKKFINGEKVTWRSMALDLMSLYKKIRRFGWTGEYFAQAAVAVMDVEDFKRKVDLWEHLADKREKYYRERDPALNEQLVNYVWDWDRSLVNGESDNEYDKDGVVFPDVEGNMWLLDRPFAEDGRHSIRFRKYDPETGVWEKLDKYIKPRGREPYKEEWIGGGTNIVELDCGYLMLYHSAVDDSDKYGGEHRSYYGHMVLLDKKDPTKILWRSERPVLSPEYYWEKRGLGGTLDHVFPEGMVALEETPDANGKVYVRVLATYGARDEFTGSAAIELEIDVKKLIPEDDAHGTVPAVKPDDRLFEEYGEDTGYPGMLALSLAVGRWWYNSVKRIGFDRRSLEDETAVNIAPWLEEILKTGVPFVLWFILNFFNGAAQIENELVFAGMLAGAAVIFISLHLFNDNNFPEIRNEKNIIRKAKLLSREALRLTKAPAKAAAGGMVWSAVFVFMFSQTSFSVPAKILLSMIGAVVFAAKTHRDINISTRKIRASAEDPDKAEGYASLSGSGSGEMTSSEIFDFLHGLLGCPEGEVVEVGEYMLNGRTFRVRLNERYAQAGDLFFLSEGAYREAMKKAPGKIFDRIKDRLVVIDYMARNLVYKGAGFLEYRNIREYASREYALGDYFKHMGYAVSAILMMQAYKGRIEGKTVLDAGCGDGILAIVAYKLGAVKVLGVDKDDGEIRDAEKLRGLNDISAEEVAFLQADLSSFDEYPFLDFETVVMNLPYFGYTDDAPGGSWAGFFFDNIPGIRSQILCGSVTKADVKTKFGEGFQVFKQVFKRLFYLSSDEEEDKAVAAFFVAKKEVPDRRVLDYGGGEDARTGIFLDKTAGEREKPVSSSREPAPVKKGPSGTKFKDVFARWSASGISPTSSLTPVRGVTGPVGRPIRNPREGQDRREVTGMLARKSSGKKGSGSPSGKTGEQPLKRPDRDILEISGAVPATGDGRLRVIMDNIRKEIVHMTVLALQIAKYRSGSTGLDGILAGDPVREVPGRNSGKIGVYIDDDLGKDRGRAMEEVKKALRGLTRRGSEDPLYDLLSGVIIETGDISSISSGVDAFVRDRGIAPENLIIITAGKDSAAAGLEKYEDVSVITRVDQDGFKGEAYYPLVEIVCFTLMRSHFLHFTEEEIVRGYNLIPNVEELDVEEIIERFWHKRSVSIVLSLPDAVPADAGFYHEIAEYIEKYA